MTHYLAEIQDARRAAEDNVALLGQLPAEHVAGVVERATARLANGLALLSAQTGHPLRAGGIVVEMVQRTRVAIATLEASL